MMPLTPQLESAIQCILANKIPVQWLQISYQSGKSFTSYLDDFCERLKWFQSWWLFDEMPKMFWLPAFFHPHRFIEAIKLNFARKNDVPIEEITLDSTVVDISVESVEGGALIYGLYLEAAHWNGMFIDEQIHHQAIEKFPMIHIKVNIFCIELFLRFLTVKKKSSLANGNEAV